MLVLSRKRNEQIVINNNITITIVEIRGDKVRIGVDAPYDIPVHRREVHEAIRSENNLVITEEKVEEALELGWTINEMSLHFQPPASHPARGWAAVWKQYRVGDHYVKIPHWFTEVVKEQKERKNTQNAKAS